MRETFSTRKEAELGRHIINGGIAGRGGEHLDSEPDVSARLHCMPSVLQCSVHLTSQGFGNGLNIEGRVIAIICV